MKKVSIITVSFNSAQDIERTILSVLEQENFDTEYIIIDGASTDETIDIISKYKDKIATYVSEPDNGIYDAMNKGIDYATGDWILFMNCGDQFVDSDVLNRLSANIDNYSDYGVIYGDTLLVLSYAKFIVKPEPLAILSKHLPFCHQSSLVKRKLLVRYKFDLSFKVVADYNLFYNLYKDGVKFLYLPMLISEYKPEGGFSASNPYRCFLESKKVSGKEIIILSEIERIIIFIRVLFLKYMPTSILHKLRKKHYLSNPRFKCYE